LVEAASERAKEAIHDASAEAVEASYNHARYAARGGAAYLDGLYVRGFWVVSGGPDDEGEARIVSVAAGPSRHVATVDSLHCLLARLEKAIRFAHGSHNMAQGVLLERMFGAPKTARTY
jgi:hypothetical protein